MNNPQQTPAAPSRGDPNARSSVAFKTPAPAKADSDSMEWEKTSPEALRQENLKLKNDKKKLRQDGARLLEQVEQLQVMLSTSRKDLDKAIEKVKEVSAENVELKKSAASWQTQWAESILENRILREKLSKEQKEREVSDSSEADGDKLWDDRDDEMFGVLQAIYRKSHPCNPSL